MLCTEFIYERVEINIEYKQYIVLYHNLTLSSIFLPFISFNYQNMNLELYKIYIPQLLMGVLKSVVLFVGHSQMKTTGAGLEFEISETKD